MRARLFKAFFYYINDSNAFEVANALERHLKSRKDCYLSRCYHNLSLSLSLWQSKNTQHLRQMSLNNAKNQLPSTTRIRVIHLHSFFLLLLLLCSVPRAMPESMPHKIEHGHHRNRNKSKSSSKSNGNGNGNGAKANALKAT